MVLVVVLVPVLVLALGDTLWWHPVLTPFGDTHVLHPAVTPIGDIHW